MNVERPPERLPSGYEEIWRLVREEERRSGSRQALARRLGVATRTLQRLLVDGDVPRFDGTRSRREVLAWCRTLTRLADHFGRDPQAVLESVGIQWDRSVAATVSRTLAALRKPTAIAPDPLRSIRAGRPPTVHVGLLGYHHFATPLRHHGASFLEILVERLVGAVDPTWRVRMIPRGIPALIRGIDEGSLHLAAAMFDTVERRSRGLAFVPIPGWSIRHTAVALRPVGETDDLPTWDEMMGGTRTDVRFHVQEQQAAHGFLKGRGVPDERIHVHAFGKGYFVPSFLEAWARHPHDVVIHVNEETTCTNLRWRMPRAEGFPPGHELVEIEGARLGGPRYPLGIVVGGAAEPWRRLLETAMTTELLGNSCVATAQLYAALIAEAVRVHAARTAPEVVEARSPWSPVAFEAPRAFREELRRQLPPLLEEVFLPRIRAASPDADPDAWTSAAGRLANAQLAELWPAGWGVATGDRPPGSRSSTPDLDSTGADAIAAARESLRSLDAHLARIRTGDLMGAPCASCGGLLSRAAGGGGLCAACVDGDGRPRSRAEVEARVVGWLREWRPELDGATARERARRILSGMPRWADGGDPG